MIIHNMATTTLAEFTATTTFEEIDSDTLDRAKQAIRDYLGVAIFGSQHKVGETVGSYVAANQPGNMSTVIGRGTASPPGAALANGAFGHAIDYDDTFESIVLHPTSPIFAATLAAAESADATGQSLLTGYVTGCETAFRIGHAIYPNHYDHGWHITGTVGTFGAAAAVASVLGLDAGETTHAFGIAASESSALKKNFGSMTKPLHAGHAAEMGLRATLLAQNGFTADKAILDDENGYGTVMTSDDSYDPEAVTAGLGEDWAVRDIVFKPYPSGVITHAAMEVMRRIVTERDLKSEDVNHISVTLDEAASDMLIHADAENALQAKFSIEFCLAAILQERNAGVHEFTDEYVAKSATREQMAKVERDFEEGLFGGDFAGYGARVTVETDGKSYQGEERKAPGSPDNPIGDDRLEGKFYECARTRLNEEAVANLSRTIEELETAGSTDALADLLR